VILVSQNSCEFNYCTNTSTTNETVGAQELRIFIYHLRFDDIELVICSKLLEVLDYLSLI